MTTWLEQVRERARQRGLPDPFDPAHLYHPGGGRGYAQTALDREVERVTSASNGTRNICLNRASFSLGQLVAGGELTRVLVERDLTAAAQLVGLPASEITRTVRSGLDAGAQQPRNVPPRDELPKPTVLTDEAAEDYWTAHTAAGGSFVLDAPSTPPAVWGDGQEVLWAEGESLMLCGPAGVGKTTVAVQLVAARLGLAGPEVLGLPVAAGPGRVLYLAMDRPPQISRAMGRLFTANQRASLDAQLTVWKGPPPYDLARRPETLVRLCELAKADTVIVDSLKDGVLKLSEDEAGGGYNKARQLALTAGVQVLEMHHQRKAGAENKRPTRLDDVYGSTWLTAGAGSVVLLWGEPGDPVVELVHLKQPAEPVGPWMVEHDHVAGWSTVTNRTDLVDQARIQGQVGLTVTVAAQMMFTVDQPSQSDIEKARRKLKTLVAAGRLVEREHIKPGGGKPEHRWYPTGLMVM